MDRGTVVHQHVPPGTVVCGQGDSGAPAWASKDSGVWTEGGQWCHCKVEVFFITPSHFYKNTDYVLDTYTIPDAIFIVHCTRDNLHPLPAGHS